MRLANLVERHIRYIKYALGLRHHRSKDLPKLLEELEKFLSQVELYKLDCNTVARRLTQAVGRGTLSQEQLDYDELLRLVKSLYEELLLSQHMTEKADATLLFPQHGESQEGSENARHI